MSEQPSAAAADMRAFRFTLEQRDQLALSDLAEYDPDRQEILVSGTHHAGTVRSPDGAGRRRGAAPLPELRD